jgi:hypothetical protein
MTYRPVGEADLTKRRKKPKQIWKKRNLKSKIGCLCVFVVVADVVAPHRLQGGEKEKKQSRANPFSGDSLTACEPTRHQMRWRVGRRATLFPASMASQTRSQHILGFFSVCFFVISKV